MLVNRLFLVLSLLFMYSCKQSGKVNYYTLSTESEQGINAVIEIPAGSNHKIEYNSDNNRFENDTLNGQIRVIDFLSYPANYGFIPSTLMDENKGGDGDALDILVIAEHLPTGTVIEVKPIATLLLNDNHELDTKIIAIPLDSSLQIISANDYMAFMTKYYGAANIIQNWFLNYKGLGETSLIGWQDEQYARQEINKWKVVSSK